MKACARCKLLTDKFYKDESSKDGLSCICKFCHNQITNRYRRTVEKVIPKRKRCPSCKENKKASEFYRYNLSRTGLQTYCKACKRNMRSKVHQKADSVWKSFISSRRMVYG